MVRKQSKVATQKNTEKGKKKRSIKQKHKNRNQKS
jgi:hypothetical protein